MDRKTKGRLAEAKSLAYLIEAGYEPFTPFVDNTKHDLLAVKESALYRISVKFTSQLRGGKWIVSLRNVHSDKNGTHTKNFTPDEYDMLMVYVYPEDRIVVIQIDKSFTNTNSVSVATK